MARHCKPSFSMKGEEELDIFLCHGALLVMGSNTCDLRLVCPWPSDVEGVAWQPETDVLALKVENGGVFLWQGEDLSFIAAQLSRRTAQMPFPSRSAARQAAAAVERATLQLHQQAKRTLPVLFPDMPVEELEEGINAFKSLAATLGSSAVSAAGHALLVGHAGHSPLLQKAWAALQVQSGAFASIYAEGLPRLRADPQLQDFAAFVEDFCSDRPVPSDQVALDVCLRWQTKPGCPRLGPAAWCTLLRFSTQRTVRPELKAALMFMVLDSNQDGRISAHELAAAFTGAASQLKLGVAAADIAHVVNATMSTFCKDAPAELGSMDGGLTTACLNSTEFRDFFRAITEKNGYDLQASLGRAFLPHACTLGGWLARPVARQHKMTLRQAPRTTRLRLPADLRLPACHRCRVDADSLCIAASFLVVGAARALSLCSDVDPRLSKVTIVLRLVPPVTARAMLQALSLLLLGHNQLLRSRLIHLPLLSRTMDSLQSHHVALGITFAVAAMLHAGAHLLNFFQSGSLAALMRPSARSSWVGPDIVSLHSYLLNTQVGLTGVLLCALVTCMTLPAAENVKTKFRRAFQSSHAVYIVLLPALLLHGCQALISTPAAPWWLAVPAALLATDKIIGFVDMHWGAEAPLSATLVSGHAVQVRIRRPPGMQFKAGSYMSLGAPSISHVEFHPFTIMSSPACRDLVLTVCAVGSWTKAFRGRVLRPGAHPAIVARGPFPSPVAAWEACDVVLLVGGGFGVTPMLAVIQDYIGRHPRSQTRWRNTHVPKTRHVHLLWLTRSHDQVHWLKGCINALLWDLPSDFPLSITLCLTRVPELAASASFGRRWVSQLLGFNPGLTTVQLGRPGLEGFLISTFTPLLRRSDKAGVFVCGPARLLQGVTGAVATVNETGDLPAPLQLFKEPACT